MTSPPVTPKSVATKDAFDVGALWQQWRDDPQDDHFDAVLSGLKPTINVALASRGNAGDPVIRAHARAIAGDAIRTYNPESGASLPTWVSQQMIRLKRIQRNTGNVVRLPERMVLDALEIERVKREWEDQHGEEPSVEDLARGANMSRKRVGSVLRAVRKTPTEEAIGESNLLLGDTSSEVDEVIDMIYEDSDTTDRKILEHRMGYGGKDVIPANVLAPRLGLSPFALSRRAQRLAYKINQVERDMRNLSSAAASGGDTEETE